MDQILALYSQQSLFVETPPCKTDSSYYRKSWKLNMFVLRATKYSYILHQNEQNTAPSLLHLSKLNRLYYTQVNTKSSSTPNQLTS